MSKRIAFTFDDESYGILEETREQGHYSSFAEAVRDSLGIFNALQEEVGHGYTELVVRDPETGKERVLVSPGLRRAAR